MNWIADSGFLMTSPKRSHPSRNQLLAVWRLNFPGSLRSWLQSARLPGLVKRIPLSRSKRPVILAQSPHGRSLRILMNVKYRASVVWWCMFHHWLTLDQQVQHPRAHPALGTLIVAEDYGFRGYQNGLKRRRQLAGRENKQEPENHTSIQDARDCYVKTFIICLHVTTGTFSYRICDGSVAPGSSDWLVWLLVPQLCYRIS